MKKKGTINFKKLKKKKKNSKDALVFRIFCQRPKDSENRLN